jgi:hypothetical protein
MTPIVKASDGRYGLRAPRGGCTVDGRRYKGGQFCRPYNVDNPHELPTVEIRGGLYLVEPLDPGEFGVSAVRITKLAGRRSYDVIRRLDGLVECDCGDYEYRRRGTAEPCKHGAACTELGLLPVAPAVVVEGGPAPSWDADRFEPSTAEASEHWEDDPEYLAWLDAMARLATERAEGTSDEPGDDWHPDERIRAIGSVEARKPGRWA